MRHHGLMRVHVIGGPGAGKTTIGHAIADGLGVRLVELDRAIAYQPPQAAGPVPFSSWDRVAWDDRLRAANALASETEWVSEGIYAGWTEPLVARADVVIWLDLPGWRAATGVLQRQRRRARLDDLDRYRWSDALRLARRAAVGYRRGPMASRDDLMIRDGANSAATTTAFLAPYAANVVRCRSRASAREAIKTLTDGRRTAP
jgi:adenylate kinase family enzyme